MTAELYWISKTVVIDWPLTLIDGTTPVTDATIVATFSLPDGTTAAGVVTQVGDVARITYDPTMAGLHTYRVTATGSADDAEEGEFVVQRSLVPALPITVDPSTTVGLARLLTADISETAPTFTDAQWSGFLAANGGFVRLAAAQALETIAASEVLTSKVIRSQDLATDGAKVAAELRAQAASLRQQHEDGWGNTGLDGTSGFTVVDYDPNALYGASGELAEISPWWLP